MQLLDAVEIPDQAHKLPANLSGGQQQRAGIARAMANDPPLLVADEPTGNLDSRTARSIVTLFERLVAQGKTVLMVTHDMDLASRAGRTVQLADGSIADGSIADGSIADGSIADGLTIARHAADGGPAGAADR